jgi:long-chain fatty acid transport protein
MTLIRLLVACAVCPLVMYGGGFQLNECGAKAVGMGFAVSAGGSDASTLFFNPAGMTQLSNGIHVTGGLSLISPGGTFTGPTNFGSTSQKTSLETWIFPIPNLYAVYKKDAFAAGVGVFVPFGLGTRFNENWAARNVAVRTYVETITINPNVAYAIMDGKLSLAAGLTYSMGRVQLKQKVTSFSPEPTLELDGSGNAVSWNAAVSYKPTQALTIGASYRHNIKIDYDGQATFTVDPSLASRFINSPGGTTLNLPFDLRTGIKYEISDKFNVELGFDYVGWSSYDTLAIRFQNAPGSPYILDASGNRIDNSVTSKNPRQYYNQYVIRLGAEYKSSNDLTLRAGTYYDPAPVDAKYTQPFLPDANRIGGSVGLSYSISNDFSFDASYLGIIGMQREVVGESRGVGLPSTSQNVDGIYNAWANVFAVGFNYKL